MKALARDFRRHEGCLLPLAPPQPLYNVCFILVLIKHHLTSTFLHCRETPSLLALNDRSSFEKEKVNFGDKRHKMYF